MNSYKWPLIFIIIMSLLAWYIFFETGVFENTEKRLTGLVAYLGLNLGLFQFWVREVNDQKRTEFNLKYQAYKELHEIIESVFRVLNHEMITNEASTYQLVSKLLMLINQFEASVKINSDLFFKGLAENKEASKIRDMLKQILSRTDKLRIAIEKSRQSDDASRLVDPIERMNWHNDVLEKLKELNEHKHAFYQFLLKSLN